MHKYWVAFKVLEAGYQALYLDFDAVTLGSAGSVLAPLALPYDLQGLSGWKDAELPRMGERVGGGGGGVGCVRRGCRGCRGGKTRSCRSWVAAAFRPACGRQVHGAGAWGGCWRQGGLVGGRVVGWARASLQRVARGLSGRTG